MSAREEDFLPFERRIEPSTRALRVSGTSINRRGIAFLTRALRAFIGPLVYRAELVSLPRYSPKPMCGYQKQSPEMTGARGRR